MDIKRSSCIEKFKIKLVITFEIVDIDLIDFYLRLKIERYQAKKTLKLSQQAGIVKVLTKFQLNQSGHVIPW